MRTIRNGFRRARGLSFSEWRLLGLAWWGLLAADVCLRVLPFSRVERLFGGRQGSAELDPVLRDRLVRAVARAARHLYPARCLPRSLCLRWLLSRHGVATDLRIGVTRQRGGLTAHAWVEHQGLPVGDAQEAVASFAALSAP
jgi:hypothetical protein